jgi:hypothetical protein
MRVAYKLITHRALDASDLAYLPKMAETRKRVKKHFNSAEDAYIEP